jgi:hypothetical protein
MTLVSINTLKQEIKQYTVFGIACFLGGYLTSCYVHKPSKLEQISKSPTSEKPYKSQAPRYP